MYSSCDHMGCNLLGSSVHGFLPEKYWSGLTFSPPGDLLDPGIEPASPELVVGFFTTEPSGKPNTDILFGLIC